MKIYLIRHGRQCSKLCNVNVDLSEEGYRQAALLGERLMPFGIQAVYSSNLLRAVETAQAANLYWNTDHMTDERLREISFGEMEGMCDEDIAVTYADFKREQDNMETDLPYPGGECAQDVINRAYPALLEIVSSGYDRVAVVTHGGVIRCLIAAILGMQPQNYRRLGSSLENCSITELIYQKESGRFTVERFNDYAHLEKEPDLLRSGWTDVEN